MRNKNFKNFNDKFFEIYPHSNFVFLNESKLKNHIIVITNNGKFDYRARRLLQGVIPTVLSNSEKINKLNSFLKEKFDVRYEIIKICNNIDFCLIKDKYGICKVEIASLKIGSNPSIRSALFKNKYFVNQIKEVHGELYDYSKVNYINNSVHIKIICKKHGLIEIVPSYLLRGRICNKCSTDNLSNNAFKYKVWFNRAAKSKYFDSFKVYIIKCFNNNETFYKIGKTYQLLKKRLIDIPYSYEIVKIFEERGIDINNSIKISKIEAELKKINKSNKYHPKISFGGQTECFTKINN